MPIVVAQGKHGADSGEEAAEPDSEPVEASELMLSSRVRLC